MKVLILLLLLSSQLSAQNLRPIPDINLRNELIKQGFVTNDSLDLRKTHGRLQLELYNKEIENLDGLQYFERVWRLTIQNNKITHLNNLPPNLTQLDCSNNNLSLIDKLPNKLKYLSCNNNEISMIKNLPSSLISLDFSNNLMKQMPKLPSALQYINYSNNLIPFESLPPLFQRLDCVDQSQNCMPYELMDWRILNASIKDSSLIIKGMTIKLNSDYSWGFGKQVETINFKVDKSKLVADKMQVIRSYDINYHPNKKDSTYTNKVEYSVETAKINQFIQDIYSNKMLVQIQVGDSVKSIDLKNKKNATTNLSSVCYDCTGYNLQYLIYSQSDTITLMYSFDSGFKDGVTINLQNGYVNIKSILDWLYIYKLTNLTFYRNKITTYFFNKHNLDKVIKWAK